MLVARLAPVHAQRTRSAHTRRSLQEARDHHVFELGSLVCARGLAWDTVLADSDRWGAPGNSPSDHPGAVKADGEFRASKIRAMFGFLFLLY